MRNSSCEDAAGTVSRQFSRSRGDGRYRRNRRSSRASLVPERGAAKPPSAKEVRADAARRSMAVYLDHVQSSAGAPRPPRVDRVGRRPEDHDEHEARGHVPDEQGLLPLMKQIESERNRRCSIDYIASTKGISEAMFLDWLDKEISDEASCLQLPFALCLVFVFAALSVAVLGNPYVQDVQNSIEVFINENANFGFNDAAAGYGHQGLADVFTVADLYSWLRLGFIPAVLSDAYGYSEFLDSHQYVANSTSAFFSAAGGGVPEQQQFAGSTRPTPLVSDFLNWNHVVGGVRLTQSVTNPAPHEKCRNVPAALRVFLADRLAPCYGNDLDAFANLQPENTLSKPVQHHSRRHTVFLPTTVNAGFTSTAELQDRVADLEKSLWIGENIRQAQVSFLSLNREYGLWTMTTISFTFRRGGTVLKDIHTQSTWLSPYGGPVYDSTHFYASSAAATPSAALANNLETALLMFFWLGMNFRIFVSEVLDMRSILRDTGRDLKRFAQLYLGVWNVVDWITFASAYVLAGLYYQENALKSELEARIHGLSDEQLYDLTVEMMDAHEEMTLFIYLYVSITLLRLFKGFSSQPRLGVVTSTMVQAAGETLHFLVVFASVFFAYVLAGVVVFGRHLPEFGTLKASVTTCWRIVMGDLDYERIYHVAPVESAAFFFSFTLLVVMIMLNMLLAIVLDTYMSVKQNRSYARSETLYSQAVETVSRWVSARRGEMVSIPKIRDALVDHARKRIRALRDKEEAKRHQEAAEEAADDEGSIEKQKEGEHSAPAAHHFAVHLNSFLSSSVNLGRQVAKQVTRIASDGRRRRTERSKSETKIMAEEEDNEDHCGKEATTAAALVKKKRTLGTLLERGVSFLLGDDGDDDISVDQCRHLIQMAGRGSELQQQHQQTSSDGGRRTAGEGTRVSSVEEMFLTTETLLEIVPGIDEPQAEGLILTALEDMFEEETLRSEPTPLCGFEALHQVLLHQVVAGACSSKNVDCHPSGDPGAVTGKGNVDGGAKEKLKVVPGLALAGGVTRMKTEDNAGPLEKDVGTRDRDHRLEKIEQQLALLLERSVLAMPRGGRSGRHEQDRRRWEVEPFQYIRRAASSSSADGRGGAAASEGVFGNAELSLHHRSGVTRGGVEHVWCCLSAMGGTGRSMK
eukprot:g6956.t1